MCCQRARRGTRRPRSGCAGGGTARQCCCRWLGATCNRPGTSAVGCRCGCAHGGGPGTAARFGGGAGEGGRIGDGGEGAIHECEESLTFNPRGSAHRPQLDAMTGLVGHYSPIVTQIIGMTRAYRDHYDSALHTDAAVAAIAEQLRRAANDARRVVTSTTEVRPALTAPLVIITPGPHWVLVGALLEGLRRIRLELLDEV